MKKYTEFAGPRPSVGEKVGKVLPVWQKPEIEVVGIAEVTKLKGGSATDGNTTLIS